MRKTGSISWWTTRAPGEEVTYFKWEFEETWEFEMPAYIVV